MTRLAMTVAGFVLLVYGLIAAVSPLPLGIIFAVLGFFMMAAANPALRPVIRRIRARWRSFDRLVMKLSPHATPLVRTVIDETAPRVEPPDPAPEKPHAGDPAP